MFYTHTNVFHSLYLFIIHHSGVPAVLAALILFLVKTPLEPPKVDLDEETHRPLGGRDDADMRSAMASMMSLNF